MALDENLNLLKKKASTCLWAQNKHLVEIVYIIGPVVIPQEKPCILLFLLSFTSVSQCSLTLHDNVGRERQRGCSALGVLKVNVYAEERKFKKLLRDERLDGFSS